MNRRRFVRRMAFAGPVLILAVWVLTRPDVDTRIQRLEMLGAEVGTILRTPGPSVVHPITDHVPTRFWSKHIDEIELEKPVSDELIRSLHLARRATTLYAGESGLDDSDVVQILDALPNLDFAELGDNQLTAAIIPRLERSKIEHLRLGGIDAEPAALVELGLRRNWDYIVALGAWRLLEEATSARNDLVSNPEDLEVNCTYSEGKLTAIFWGPDEQREYRISAVEVDVLRRLPPLNRLNLEGRVDPSLFESFPNKSELTQFEFADVSPSGPEVAMAAIESFPNIRAIILTNLDGARWSATNFDTIGTLPLRWLTLSFVDETPRDSQALARAIGPSCQHLGLTFMEESPESSGKSGTLAKRAGPLRLLTTPLDGLTVHLENWTLDAESIASLPSECCLELTNCDAPWVAMSEWLARCDQTSQLAGLTLYRCPTITPADFEALASTPGEFELNLGPDEIWPRGNDFVNSPNPEKSLAELRDSIATAIRLNKKHP